MSQEVWRIGYCPLPALPMSALLTSLGYGSTLASGRWHRQGPPQVVYAASSRALCQLERLVHANGAAVRDQALMRLTLPPRAVLESVTPQDLPPDWPDRPELTQDLGQQWLARGESLGLWVPSAVEPGDCNLLINPAHADYAGVALTLERYPFRFDSRLFG